MGNNDQPNTKVDSVKVHERHRRRKLSSEHSILKWLLLFIVLVSATFIALYLNQQSEITTSKKIEYTIDVNETDENINWKNYPTHEIELVESLDITESGTYRLTGNLKNGQVRIKDNNSHVRLILDDVSIKNNDGPAIFCESAEHLVVELSGKNTIEDGEIYANNYDSDVSGVIYSKSDLVFQGEGQLMVKANYLDGIVGKDSLKFNGGTYIIESKDDAIRGKDSVYIKDGAFLLNAAADAIKSTNDTDTGKGFVLIERGSFNIKADAKAIKAYNAILIHGGDFSLNAYDDAIHSDNYIGITGGNVNINAGDDGIHANRKVIIDDGRITVAMALEGIEAKAVTINGGTINLKTINDGINTSKESSFTAEDDPRPKIYNENEECILSINGGDIYINADGDGVDSNGWIYFNGGTTTIDGPGNSKNGALDATVGIVMNGGTVLAIGDSTMAISLGNTSSILNANIYLNTTLPAGSNIEIKNQSGDILFSHESAKPFNNIAVGSPRFILGEEYTLYINQEEKSHFIITDISTIVNIK